MRQLVGVFAAVTELILFAPSVTSAQPLAAGVKIGIDISSLPNAGEVIDRVVKQVSVETSSKTGVTFGGFVTLPVAEHLSFQPELMFVGKGVKVKEANGDTLTASLKYIEFPLLLRYSTSFSGNPFFLLVGPTFGVKASTSGHFDNSGVEPDIDPAISSFDGGIAFGAGIDYRRFVFEVRYTQGLNDVGTDVFPHSDSLRNRVFAVLAGYRIK
jgi:hypothetical protein